MGANLLIVAGILSLGVAAFHVVGAFSRRVCRAMGAPEPFLALNPVIVTLVTLGLAAVFAIWGAYGLSGGGATPRLPLLAPAIAAIAAVYTLRGLGLAPQLAAFARHAERQKATPVWLDLAYSAVSLAIGLAYGFGAALTWSELWA